MAIFPDNLGTRVSPFWTYWS